METILEIRTKGTEAWAEEFYDMLKVAGVKVNRSNDLIFGKNVRVRGPSFPPEMMVALTSAGAFTTFYQVICKLLEKNKYREITIQRKGTRVSIKGHTLPEERELLEKLVPEFMHYKKDSTSEPA